ncbi:Histone-lysine N-methyltransferase TRX1 [Hondaea fermentalgiana]|uniref:Histone-lysine N-methyltransferase TRX1 n=1 Tax=Hondaea fermentalgiana TaxID=2315210 RepID=A0A2R5GQ63_9STRA|nr:Histone-lysine N-methyltransferase TRX1 [Hondaea fermentalgiana]|eukprot:GBG30491.1 Histone-lysine N-methyltransferase TRX1 [Hondaea fermentalgiana]
MRFYGFAVGPGTTPLGESVPRRYRLDDTGSAQSSPSPNAVEDEYELVPYMLGMPEDDGGRANARSAHPTKAHGADEMSPEEMLKRGEKDPAFALKLLGTRVELKWSSGRWYRGTICEYNESLRKHHVVYDDGDERWYHLNEMIYRFVKDDEEWVKC